MKMNKWQLELSVSFLNPERKKQFTWCMVVASADTSKIANILYSLEHTTNTQQSENVVGQLLKATSPCQEQQMQ